MAARDPEKTRRNKKIAALTEEIQELKGEVLRITGYRNEHSLNATYGGKFAEYIDIKNVEIYTPDHFITLYFQGFLSVLESLGLAARPGNPYFDAHQHIKKSKVVRKWIKLFLSRAYLRQYDALSRRRPEVEDAEIWIGQKNASYGIFVTPRFKGGEWENDKSEIRHFRPKYWSIGHILKTGFVVPDEDQKIEFSSVKQYLSFFRNTLVRNSGSIHEKKIADLYCSFVLNSDKPEDVPLLIPELRYGGKEARHEYRLDFTVINPYTLEKVGFEISPWSTHGFLKGVREKTQAQVNEEAKGNFERDMRKLKAYFRKRKIPVLVYTDSDLIDLGAVFREIEEYLRPVRMAEQLQMHVLSEFLAFKPVG